MVRAPLLYSAARPPLHGANLGSTKGHHLHSKQAQAEQDLHTCATPAVTLSFCAPFFPDVLSCLPLDACATGDLSVILMEVCSAGCVPAAGFPSLCTSFSFVLDSLLLASSLRGAAAAPAQCKRLLSTQQSDG